MLQPRIANRHAEALFAIARERGTAAEWVVQLAEAQAALAASPDLRAALEHPEVGLERKERLLRGSLGEGVSDEVVATLLLLVRRGHEPDAEALRAAFAHMWDEERGVAHATVTSAVALDAAQAARLAAALGKRTGRKVTLTQEVDGELIAGLTVTIGDRVIDASARKALAELRGAMRGY